jgi:hypothetical protein
MIINLPVLVLLPILMSKPAGFWIGNRWISEDRVWYGVSAVAVVSCAWALLALFLSRRHFSRWRSKWAVGAIVLALLNVFLARSIYPAGIHKHYNLKLCMSNLWTIGLQIRLYGNEHAGKYPDSLETLILDEDADASPLNCPVSGDPLIADTNRKTVATALAQPGHVSYLYFGRNLNASTTSASTVIACDKPHNHDGPEYDCCALFADGTVRLIPQAQVMRLIAQQSAAGAPASSKPAKP